MEVLNFWTLTLVVVLFCSSETTARPRHGVLLCVGQGANNVLQQYEESPVSMQDDGEGGVSAAAGRNLLFQDSADFMDTPLQKRSALGLFGLATKRPHKSVADLMHPPPLDAFMSVRGKKRSSDSSGNSWGGSSGPRYVFSGYPPSLFRE